MGPFTPKGQTVDVDAIIQEGLAGSGVGAPTNVPTATTPPIPGVGNPVAGANTQTGRGFSGFDVEQPTWAWRPTQQDFGQVDPYKDQYKEGDVLTVRAEMPFSAFANRQQALEQKKAALAQKMAAYDPYAGIGKAHDRYQTAFNRYAVNYINQKRQGIADSMFGGDMALADRYLGTDPQGRAMLAQWGSEMQALGSENKAWTDSFIDLTSRVASGETYVPPEYMNDIMQFGSALGNDGLPVQGMEVSEFLPKGRNAEGRLREIQYVDEIVTPGLKNALKTTTGIDIGNRRKGGKIVMTEREEKTFDDALKYFVNSEDGQDFVELYHGGDKDKAFAALKSFFPTSVKEDVTLTSPYNPNEGNSGSSATEGKTWAGSPSEVTTYSTVPGESGEGMAVRGYRLPFGQVVAGRNENMTDRVFVDAYENSINMKPEAIMYIPSEDQYYVEGKLTGDQTVEVSTTQSGSSRRGGKKSTETRKANESYRVPLTSGNEESLRAYLPDFDWRSRFAGVGQQPQQSPAPKSGKSLSMSTIKGLVGKDEYSGYTEQELVDYYKSQGYTIE